MGMTMEAQEAKKIYKRQYRSKNRDRINAQQRAWNARNRDKLKEYQRKYWEKKAETGNIRLPWSAYGITEERYNELLEAARSGQYDAEVLSAAAKADRQAAEHIILSVVEGVSYERLEFHEKLGRCTLGRTNFYGARRLFFHYLDCALKKQQKENNMEVENG
ncbi:MAG: hypothetical protein K2J60_07910 [Acetatifactor sp.]|nr:hypothetical protein [Acetatifactor sp.]